MLGTVADAAVDIRIVERLQAERRADVIDRIRQVAAGRRQRAVEIEHQQVYSFLHPRNVECQDSVRTHGCQRKLLVWAAKDARIFEKYGLDATIIFISGSVRGIQAILAGEIPIGEGGGPGLASAKLAGGDVVAIAGNVNVLPYYLVAQPSIKRPEELRGKIGGNHIAGTTAEFALRV